MKEKKLDIWIISIGLSILVIIAGVSIISQIYSPPTEVRNDGCQFSEVLSLGLLLEMQEKSYSKYNLCKYEYCFHEWHREEECKHLGQKDGSDRSW